MKAALFILIALAAAVCTNALPTSQPAITYGPWSACNPNTCTQTRSRTGCLPADAAFCNATAYSGTVWPLISVLTCQSCTIDAATCPSLPTSWQGVYTAAPTCNQNFPADVGNGRCCCMTGNVFVRQYDELVEITFPEGVGLTGSGCFITAQAAGGSGNPALAGAPLFPKGISFKVVDLDTNPTAGTIYSRNSLFKDSAQYWPPNSMTPNPQYRSELPDTEVPAGVKSAGQVNILGRTYRAILTCGKIYIFGQTAFNEANTDVSLCPQVLTYIGPLANS